MSPDVYADIIGELREIDRNVSTLRGELGAALATISAKVDVASAASADHEQRIRHLEAWKARAAGQAALLASLVAIGVSVAMKLL